VKVFGFGLITMGGGGPGTGAPVKYIMGGGGPSLPSGCNGVEIGTNEMLSPSLAGGSRGAPSMGTGAGSRGIGLGGPPSLGSEPLSRNTVSFMGTGSL